MHFVCKEPGTMGGEGEEALARVAVVWTPRRIAIPLEFRQKPGQGLYLDPLLKCELRRCQRALPV